MAGHWANAPADEATERADVPLQRRAADRQAQGGRSQARRADARQGDGHRTESRRAAGRGPDNRRSSKGSSTGTCLLLALGLPVVGALLDELIGSGPGTLLAVLTVLGTAGAAMLAGRAGWWWVLPAPPPVVFTVTAASAYLADSAKYAGSKNLALGAGKWAIHGFPVMVYAMAAALLVIVVRVVRDRRNRRG